VPPIDIVITNESKTAQEIITISQNAKKLWLRACWDEDMSPSEVLNAVISDYVGSELREDAKR